MFTINQNQSVPAGSPFSAGSALGVPKTDKSPLILVFGLIFLNIVAGSLVGYAFYMKSSYETQNNSKKENLSKVVFTSDVTLQTMQDFSGRIKAFSAIFNNAPSSYSLFTILEQAIIRGITLTDMVAVRIEGTKSYTVTLTGSAKSFQDLIAQRDIFRSKEYSNYVSDVVVSSYDLNTINGGVKFTMKMQISVGRFSKTNVLIDLSKPVRQSTNDQDIDKMPVVITPVVNEATTFKTVTSTSTKVKTEHSSSSAPVTNNTI